MANSYLLYTGNGSTTQYSLAGIDGWISTGFLKVYFNDNVAPEATSGYTFIDLTTAPKIQFTVAPPNNTVIRIQRETPSLVSTFRSNVVDFEDTSILTADDLDKALQGALHIVQEANDTGSGALPPTADGTHWNAESKRITNTGVPTGPNDAVNKAYADGMILYGSTTVTQPQSWTFSGNSSTTDFTFSPTAATTDPAMFIVEVGGTIQQPTTDYTVTASTLSFVSAPATGVDNIRVRNLGVTRSVQSFPSNVTFGQDIFVNGSVNTTGNVVATGFVGTAVLASGTVVGGAISGTTVASSGAATLNSLGVTTNATVGGTLNVTGASTLGTLGAGASILSSLGVTNNATVGGTLNATGASTLGTLGAGTSTLSSLGVTNNATVGGTLAVTGQATFGSVGQSLINKQFSDSVASGTSLSASFPTWVRRVTISLAAVSTTGTNPLYVRFSRGITIETANYASRMHWHGVAWATVSNGFQVTGTLAAANNYSGMLVFDRVDTAGTVWVLSGQVMDQAANTQFSLNGYYSGGSTAIDGIQIFPSSGQSFDGGRIAISWE